MKKLLIIALSLLLALKSGDAQAQEARCDSVNGIQPKIIEIQEFARAATAFTTAEFTEIIAKLRADTENIALNAIGCDEYNDRMLAQMYGAIEKLNSNIGLYTQS